MSGLRVVLVTRRFWPLVGGAEMVMANLAASLRQLGAEPTIVTAQWEPEWPREVVHREVPVQRLPNPQRRGWGTLRYMWSLARWLRSRRSQYDAVCVSMLKHSAYAALASAGRLGAPVMLRAEGGGATGDCHWQQTGRFGARIRRRCQRADAVVAPSRSIVRELSQAGYDPARTHFIPNGVDVLPRADAAAARAALAEANPDLAAMPDAPIVAYTGRLDRKKGLFDLVRAFEPIVRRRPAARLWLIGEGPDRDSLFQLVRDLDLQHRVLLPGAFDQVDDVLQAADLFVLPSYEEGMSLSLLEAMGCGLPVVASDIPGNRTLVDHQRHGLLTPPRDVASLTAAIESLLDDNSLATRLGDEGRRRVLEHYTLERCAQAHLNLLQRMVELRATDPSRGDTRASLGDHSHA